MRVAVPTGPTAIARSRFAYETERSCWPVIEGCTTNQVSPRSWVPAITPPSPTAQPSWLPVNATLRSASPPGMYCLSQRRPWLVERMISPFAPTANAMPVSPGLEA